jgi:hypothetical protein
MTLNDELLYSVEIALSDAPSHPVYDVELRGKAAAAVEAVRNVIRMRLAASISVKERHQLLMMLFVTGDKFGFCHGSDTAACWLRDAFEQLQAEEARREAPQEGA